MEVATRSMNAQEAAEVNATMTIKKSIPQGTKTGSIMAVVTKLEVTPVKKIRQSFTSSIS